ncbi:hypothetical protein LGK95_16120 [Clostridium algoriphilum]|uniref:hypothetical protein n=1 Tax=Clostridium algoriphilum TaxID=198347 RepID=UPI001CF14975|nr:hypothetical protein [Clostridium algoriphilum]MCB2295011.1 hypothetical protein [Clostridium algoriphilum]
MKNIIIKEISKKVYFYFSWGYCDFSVGFLAYKKIYKIFLNNELNNKTMIPAYADL